MIMIPRPLALALLFASLLSLHALPSVRVPADHTIHAYFAHTQPGTQDFYTFMEVDRATVQRRLGEWVKEPLYENDTRALLAHRPKSFFSFLQRNTYNTTSNGTSVIVAKDPSPGVVMLHNLLGDSARGGLISPASVYAVFDRHIGSPQRYFDPTVCRKSRLSGLDLILCYVALRLDVGTDTPISVEHLTPAQFATLRQRGALTLIGSALHSTGSAIGTLLVFLIADYFLPAATPLSYLSFMTPLRGYPDLRFLLHFVDTFYFTRVFQKTVLQPFLSTAYRPPQPLEFVGAWPPLYELPADRPDYSTGDVFAYASPNVLKWSSTRDFYFGQELPKETAQYTYAKKRLVSASSVSGQDLIVTYRGPLIRQCEQFCNDRKYCGGYLYTADQKEGFFCHLYSHVHDQAFDATEGADLSGILATKKKTIGSQ